MAKLNGDLPSFETDIEVCVIRQSGAGFHSPGMMRKSLGPGAIVAHSSKTSRRAKSTEPIPLKPDDPFVKYSQKSQEETASHVDNFPLEKRLSTMMKEQEHMSKSEIINCYRLLMSEKLRLERFLSIITKNNEMARNRLESDLLDAMMCIEDLKQALEVRMARRRRVDPHEAEERRYLIRQNKKLLSQLYESAKKIEHLEVTKVEMKEQLELLDFQIVEVENQKAILEEELRKCPPCTHQEIQTEETCGIPPAAQLMSELADYQMEQTALLARQHQLDAVIRQLRRENVELRDQLTKLEDAENSLTESDKPWAAGLQRQLEEQNERLQEVECKLQAARNYASQLETKLSQRSRSGQSMDMFQAESEDAAANVQALMQANQESAESGNTFRKPHVDDLLLQETIRTFHSLLAERDRDIAQLKHQLRFLHEKNPNSAIVTDLPALVEADVQTESDLQTFGKSASPPIDTCSITEEEYARLSHQVDALEDVLSSQGYPSDESRPGMSSLDRLLATVAMARVAITSSSVNDRDQPTEAVSLSNGIANGYDEASGQTDPGIQAIRLNALQREVERLTKEVQRLQKFSPSLANKQENSTCKESLASTTPANSKSDLPVAHRGKHFSLELQKLRDTSELELAQSRLQLAGRRVEDLEKQITDLTEEVSRARAEARSAETSLTAARRTEVALRRRLIAAMDAPTSQHRRAGNSSEIAAASVRHSTSAMLSAAVGDFRDTVEMQATLLSLECRNAALQEAAQLDRTRLHEQTVRIGQLEAEHRALLARLGQLQTGEAAAQRGIVRLQALYEDMLREYSEARSQELNWKPRSRSRSALQPTNDHGPVSSGPSRTSSVMAKFQNDSG